MTTSSRRALAWCPVAGAELALAISLGTVPTHRALSRL